MKNIQHLSEELGGTEERPIEYKKHPSAEILKRYILKQLPKTLPFPHEILSRLVTGELAEEEWTSLLTGAHIRTCKICASMIEQLRLEDRK
jgi:hypothetical protein